MAVTISMSERQAGLLAEIIDSYFQPGTPITECAPEWEFTDGREPYTAAEVLELGRQLSAALKEG